MTWVWISCLLWAAGTVCWVVHRRRRKAQHLFGEPADKLLERIRTEPQRIVRRGGHRIERREGIDMGPCPHCGQDVVTVQLMNSQQQIILDCRPDPHHGTVIVLGNRCRYVSGDDWKVIRENKLPVYRRHGLHCTGFWEGKRRGN